MPKTKAERNIYVRQWRKDAYNEKRFNKGLHEYLEIKYLNIFNEYVQFYTTLNEAHPEAKDITKTKTYKRWKKIQQTEPPRNTESPEPSRNTESPEPSRNADSPEPLRNTESPEPPRNAESPEPPRNTESPEPSRNADSPEPPRNTESPEPPRNTESPEPPRNTDSPEQNERDILAEALGEPLLPVANLNIDELDNIVQGMIDELRRDDDVRALLDNEELFPPQHREEDEGIAMDMEVEIDDLYDLRLEEALRY